MGATVFPGGYRSGVIVWRGEDGRHLSSSDPDPRIFRNAGNPDPFISDARERLAAYIQARDEWYAHACERAREICPYAEGETISLKGGYLRMKKAVIREIMGYMDPYGGESLYSYALKCVMLKRNGSESGLMVSVLPDEIDAGGK